MNITYFHTQIKKTALCFAITAFGTAAHAATYHVSVAGNDANPGTAAAPWRTIAKAASVMVGGDTTIVGPGSYSEKTATKRAGSADKRITFKASGDVVTKTFNIDHDHVTIDGFRMTAANDGYMMTIRGSHCEIVNNTMHDTGSQWGVVRMDSNTITGCSIRNNRYYSSTGPGDDLTVFIVGGKNNVVENNEIGPGKDLDVFRVWGNGNIIRGNYIHDVTLSSGSSSHMDVIQTFGLGGGESRNIVFEGNRVVNFDGQICMTENNGSPGYRDWDVRNNLFVNVNLQANIGIPNFRFYNNTLYNVGSTNKLVMYLYDGAGKSDFSGARIFNNSFITAAAISSYGQVMSIGRTGSDVVISNNHVARISSHAALSGYAEVGGLNGGDPKFVNAAAGDFRLLSNSPLIDRGLALTGVSTDYDRQPRLQGSAVDLGAFELSNTAIANAPPAPLNLTVR